MTELGSGLTKQNEVVDMNDDQAPANVIPYTNEAGDQYDIGDSYGRSPMSQEWEIDTTNMPYLAHIKSLSNRWKPLRHLADWMEVGTDPQRWRDIRGKPGQRRERAERTKVTVIDFSPDGERPSEQVLKNSGDLQRILEKKEDEALETTSFRLFLVEDLSQRVIELFGSRFDIDPLFFREQIGDYNWFNTRDSWAMGPSLIAGMKHRSWLRMRHCRFRFMPDTDSFLNAVKESNTFNVFRRPDDDGNFWPYRDRPGTKIVMTRAKTSIWIGKDPRNKNQAVGIVLVDPTSTEGHPLWYGPGNWSIPPGMNQHGTGTGNPSWPSSLYDLILDATRTYPWFEALHPRIAVDSRIFVFPTLFTICAEWLVAYEYIKARISQIDWELEKPHIFRPSNDRIDSSLKRLHVWRRVLPVIREMVEETIEHALPSVSRLTDPPVDQKDSLEAILPDFERVRDAFNELQRRVDRLTEVVAAEISTEDSRRSLKENHNLSRLTWLATIFVPLSFLASFFSMSGDLSEMRYTFLWFFVAAIPLTAVTLTIAGVAGRGWFKKTKLVESVKYVNREWSSRKK